jgi:hypothetical protein
MNKKEKEKKKKKETRIIYIKEFLQGQYYVIKVCM